MIVSILHVRRDFITTACSHSFTSDTYSERLSLAASIVRLFGFLPCPERTPNEALRPSLAPGHCWPMSGSAGRITVQLSRPVVPSRFTVDHAHRSVALRADTAPRSCEVWVCTTKLWDAIARLAVSRVSLLSPQGYPSGLESQPRRLAVFEYMLDGPASQTFVALPSAVRGEAFSHIQLRVLSNHGSAGYTCLYRFRVAGSDISV